MNDLGRRDRLRVALHKLIALGEAAFPEELTLYVRAVGHLAIRVFDALLDNLCARLPILMQVGGTGTSLRRGMHQLLGGNAAAGARAACSGSRHMASLVVI